MLTRERAGFALTCMAEWSRQGPAGTLQRLAAAVRGKRRMQRDVPQMPASDKSTVPRLHLNTRPMSTAPGKRPERGDWVYVPQ